MTQNRLERRYCSNFLATPTYDTRIGNPRTLYTLFPCRLCRGTIAPRSRRYEAKVTSLLKRSNVDRYSTAINKICIPNSCVDLRKRRWEGHAGPSVCLSQPSDPFFTRPLFFAQTYLHTNAVWVALQFVIHYGCPRLFISTAT